MRTPSDEYYMARAIALAETALGRTSPNPAVGCVIVSSGEVVGEGYHPGAGQPHAEIFALRAAGEDARGSTVYVTLEPCSTYGRTPPCVDALVSAGVAAVVYGTLDPDPVNHREGVARLEAAGIECRRAGDERFLRDLNRGFFSWMERGRPYVSLKVATTLDGRIALGQGAGSRLSGAEADAWTHRWRAAADAVMVGIGTALTDDPLLTARPPEGCSCQPTRVVLDSKGRLDPSSQLVKTAARTPLLVVTTKGHDPSWEEAMTGAGAQVAEARESGGMVDISSALEIVGRLGMLEIAVEPGAGLMASLVESGMLDQVNFIVTGWMGGDRAAPRWFDKLTHDRAEGRWDLANVVRMGPDVLLTVTSEAWSPGAREGGVTCSQG
jgi:diaminohydroxyphosphoribosylaminopyrimidine deaminase/5-amino-6-(5-phosphoribosylamino)uracil reductase